MFWPDRFFHATKGDTLALFEREKCFENEYHNTRSLPFNENIADEVKSVTLVLLLGWFVIGVHFYKWYTVFLQGMRTPNAAVDCLQPEKSGTELTLYSNIY